MIQIYMLQSKEESSGGDKTNCRDTV